MAILSFYITKKKKVYNMNQVLNVTRNLDVSREDSFFPLRVPLLDPHIGAHRVEHLLKVVAGGVVGAANSLASMVVDVALEAVPRLVRIGEPGVERDGFDVFERSCGHGAARKSGLFLANFFFVENLPKILALNLPSLIRKDQFQGLL